MTIKHTRCNTLGVCQGLGADHCPDCDYLPYCERYWRQRR